MPPLFTQEFIDAAAALSLAVRRVAARGRHAEQRSRDLGAGLEFRDFRSYLPGDDMRRIDWNLFQRSGRLFLRLFEEVEDLPVYLLLDSSDSMYFETPPRADAARQAAAIFAIIALNQHDRVTLHPFGAELTSPLPPLTGKLAVPRLLEALQRQTALGRTDVPAVLRRFNALKLRPGLVVLVSDTFDPAGLDALIDALARLRHQLLLVQVTRAADAAPVLAGEQRLIDCETGAAVDVVVTAAQLRQYRRTYDDYCRRLRAFLAARQAPYLSLDADHDVMTQVRRLFLGHTLVV